MTAPSATIASKRRDSAIRRTTGGRSKAPGTRTSSSPPGSAPCDASASEAPATRRSTTAALKRDAASPMRRPPARKSPSRTFIALIARVYQALARSLLVAGDFEAERGDAEELPRRRQHAHARDAEVAQDLRADPVGAQHRAALARILRGLARPRADDVRRRLLRAQHDDYAVRLARDALERAAQRPRAGLCANTEQVARRVAHVHAHERRLP